MMHKSEITVVSLTSEKIKLSAKCPICGKSNAREFENSPKFVEGWQKFITGELVQNAFPWMSVDDREFFITGSCPCIWDCEDLQG